MTHAPSFTPPVPTWPYHSARISLFRVCYDRSYEPHGVPLYYAGAPVTLTAAQEEVATFYALCPEDGPQLGDKETRPVFQKNFFEVSILQKTILLAELSSNHCHHHFSFYKKSFFLLLWRCSWSLAARI